ncbi:MAG: IPT/TIG domain-containing protein [Pseudonocardia sp.]|nr:IPT/TIG domain-containing protein [Pseudonocardia sp.]
MRRSSKLATAFGATLACSVLWAPAPVDAAPGDASARGAEIAIQAEVANAVVFTGFTTQGIADAPAGGGTDTHSNIGVGLSGGGFDAFGTVGIVTATHAPTESSANSHVSGIEMNVVSAPVLLVGDVDATVTCPTNGPISGHTSVANLMLFGAPVTLGTTAITVSGPVPVAGPTFTGGTLSITLQSVEPSTGTGTDATAVGVTATMTLSVVSSGTSITVPAGTFTLASASCTRPAPGPTAPIASGMVPISGPTAGGQTVTVLGAAFPPGGAIVTFGGVPGSNVVVAGDGTSLTVVAPPGSPGPVSVVVITPQASTTVPIPYTYVGGGPSPSRPSGAPSRTGGSGKPLHPFVRSITPTHGPAGGGTRVSIVGSGFLGVTRVTFAGVAGTGLTVNSAGTLVTVTAPHTIAGTTAVLLQWADGHTFSAGDFTVGSDPASSATTASPSAPTGAVPGTGGELATTGSNLALVAWLGLGLVALGAVLHRRRRRSAQPPTRQRG